MILGDSCSVHPDWLESSIHWVLRLFLTKEDLVELYRIVVFYYDNARGDMFPYELEKTKYFCGLLYRVLRDELYRIDHEKPVKYEIPKEEAEDGND